MEEEGDVFVEEDDWDVELVLVLADEEAVPVDDVCVDEVLVSGLFDVLLVVVELLTDVVVLSLVEKELAPLSKISRYETVFPFDSMI